MTTLKQNAKTLFKTVGLPLAAGIFIYKFLMNHELKNCLPGKVVVITGASSGLGEALAHTFYIAGCKVVLAARRKEELDRVRNDLMQMSVTHTTHPPVILLLDLIDVQSFPEKIQKVLDIHGHIDILVNNGGISVRSEAIDTTIEVDMKMMQVNYFGAVVLTKAVLPSMIKRKQGRILFIGSLQGKFGMPERSAYGASKHALEGFCDSLRAEVNEENIKVTMVSPSYINTSLSLNAITGSGEKFGANDDATASGDDRFELANEILRRILSDEKDVILGPMAHRFLPCVRSVYPEMYFWIMARRAKSLRKQKLMSSL